MAVSCPSPRTTPKQEVREHKTHRVTHCISRWWFQTFFILIPTWGNDPI